MKYMYRIIEDKLKKGSRRRVTVVCTRCGQKYERNYDTVIAHNKYDRGCISCGNETHGECGSKNGKTREYVTWRDMLARCEQPSSRNYKWYGEKGIKVCKRWHDYRAFLKDMGRKPTPKHTLDRIDPDGDYCPENCRWATPKEQAMNKKSTTIIEWNGEKDSITGWAKRLDMVVPVIKRNYEMGLPLDTRCRPRANRKINGRTVHEWAEYLDVKYAALARFLRTHDWDTDAAIAYYTSPTRRKYPWTNRPSEKVRSL